jgi:NAD/FAD-utilizing enzyme apparently involved in cell division
MQNILLNTNNLEVIEGSVINLIIKNNRANGITLDNGNEIFSTAVVLTTGTFLSGVIHIGNKKIVGGRVGEKSETELSKQIKNFDFKIGRLKTGTPPRLLSKSINYNNLEKQEGDISPKFMSFLTTKTQNPQISCYLTRTNINTHHIISNNIHNSAIYNGNITSSGPRYCPSIEDKVNRFAHKDNHQVFLEPEGLNSNIIYPNGISTSLPQDVQEKFIRTIPGLEDCKITQPGYAIEYDFIDPTQLKSTLETKKIKSLFFAGQINGTTGYEEAGAQGLVAGVNAAFKSYTNKSFIIDRTQAYMGVLIDDLI